MTDQEFAQLCILLDQLWGGLDEGREAALFWLLGEKDHGLVLAAVRGLAEENREWLPKPPEIAYRVIQLEKQQASERRIGARLRRLTRQLEQGAGS